MGRRWILWLVVIIIGVIVVIGGAMLWKSKSEQAKMEQIRQEAIKAGVEEKKEIYGR